MKMLWTRTSKRLSAANPARVQLAEFERTTQSPLNSAFCVLHLACRFAYRWLRWGIEGQWLSGISTTFSVSSKDASEEDIKKAYRKQAMKHHPDRNQTKGDEKSAKSLGRKIQGGQRSLRDAVRPAEESGV